MDFISILPNLSIGVVAIGALVYVVLNFLKHLDKQHTEHRKELGELHDKHQLERKEVEIEIRELEREVRTTILEQLGENTQVYKRVIDHLEK